MERISSSMWLLVSWVKFLADNQAERPPLGGADMERLAKASSEKAVPLMLEAGLMKTPPK